MHQYDFRGLARWMSPAGVIFNQIFDTFHKHFRLSCLLCGCWSRTRRGSQTRPLVACRVAIGPVPATAGALPAIELVVPSMVLYLQRLCLLDDALTDATTVKDFICAVP